MRTRFRQADAIVLSLYHPLSRRSCPLLNTFIDARPSSRSLANINSTYLFNHLMQQVLVSSLPPPHPLMVQMKKHRHREVKLLPSFTQLLGGSFIIIGHLNGTPQIIADYDFRLYSAPGAR